MHACMAGRQADTGRQPGRQLGRQLGRQADRDREREAYLLAVHGSFSF